MKFICLHGYGTSSEIFEQQLATITGILGDQHQFVYLDGEVEVAQPGELAGLFSGKHLAFYTGHRSEDVRLAHNLLEETLAAEEIPFDGIIGFSQGASIAISYVLEQQILKPDEIPPFRVGIFFTPSVVISPDPDYHKELFLKVNAALDQQDHEKILSTVVQNTTKLVGYSPTQDFPEFERVPSPEREIILELTRNTKAFFQIRHVLGVEEGIRPSEETDENEWKAMVPRFFNPIYTPQRVPFPTVHINGDGDVTPSALAQYAMSLCAPSTVIPVAVRCGHEIPRKKQDVDNVVKAIEKAMYLGQKM